VQTKKSPNQVVAEVDAAMEGQPIDSERPAIVIRSVRLVPPDAVSSLIASGQVDADDPEMAVHCMTIEFEIEGKPGIWHCCLLAEEFEPAATAYYEPDSGQIEHAPIHESVAGEIRWRLREWERTRSEPQDASSPRLLPTS
jgi:hypothetical protein